MVVITKLADVVALFTGEAQRLGKLSDSMARLIDKIGALETCWHAKIGLGGNLRFHVVNLKIARALALELEQKAGIEMEQLSKELDPYDKRVVWFRGNWEEHITITIEYLRLMNNPSDSWHTHHMFN